MAALGAGDAVHRMPHAPRYFGNFKSDQRLILDDQHVADRLLGDLAPRLLD